MLSWEVSESPWIMTPHGGEKKGGQQRTNVTRVTVFGQLIGT